MNEEQLSALTQALEEFRKNGELSSDALAALTQKVDPATKAFNKVESALKGFANGVGRAANDLAKVNGGFTNLNGSIDAISGGMNAVAKNFGVAGKAVGLAAQAIGGYAKFVMNQLNDVSKMYDSLGDISAIGEKGVTGLKQMFDTGGLATANMENFAKALAANSQGIASFGSGMSQGAERFKEVASGLTRGRTAERFLALGIGIDSVTNSAAQFVSTQTRNGGMLGRSNSDVIRTTREYIEQLDLLARMTGNTRAQQEEEARKSQSNARFRAVQAELNAKGMNKSAQNLQLLADTLGGDVGDSVRDISAFGVSTTKQSAEVNMLSRDMVRQVTMAVKRDEMTVAQGVERIQEGLAQGGKTFQNTIKAVGNDLAGWSQALDARAMVDITNQLSEKLGRRVTREELAADTQGKLLKTLDKQTQEFVKSRLNIAESGKSVKSLQMALALDAIPAVETFTNVIQAATKKVAKLYGIDMESDTDKAIRVSKEIIARRNAVSAPAMASKPTPLGQAPAAPGADYISKVAGLESNNRNIGTQIKDKSGRPASGAFGLYQITPDTYSGIRGLAPAGSRLKTASFEDMKKDVELQTEAMKVLTQDNARLLAQRGLSTSDAAKYMAHVLGYPVAARVLEARGDANIKSIVPASSMANNPKLFEGVRTAGELRGSFNRETGGGGFQQGGVAIGPKSGHMELLHGIEAVVPLPDGKTIPVSMNVDELVSRLAQLMSTQSSGNSGNGGIMSEQLARLDTLIDVMQDQVSVSNKILRAQQ